MLLCKILNHLTPPSSLPPHPFPSFFSGQPPCLPFLPRTCSQVLAVLPPSILSPNSAGEVIRLLKVLAQKTSPWRGLLHPLHPAPGILFHILWFVFWAVLITTCTDHVCLAAYVLSSPPGCKFWEDRYLSGFVPCSLPEPSSMPEPCGSSICR